MKALWLTFMQVLCVVSLAIGQPVLRHLATGKVQQRLLEEHPEILENRRNIEQFTAQFRVTGHPLQVTIPMVFHIVYATSGEMVGMDQVYSQIEALNRDFRNFAYQNQHPADELEGFAERVADTQIEFCLALDTHAVRYVSTQVAEWGADDAVKFSAQGGSDVYDPDHLLNVWVCHLADSVSGYAQMPGGPSITDGIVIDYRFFGTMGTAQPPYHQGKSLTHLIGNYLNLFDLWGEGTCNDDYVSDTPIHNAPNYGCPGYRHISTCKGGTVEMTMNFMDNTYDSCMYMFTYGQMMRMQAVLAQGGARHSLTQGAVACEPEFESRSPGSAGNERPYSSESIQRSLWADVVPNPAHQQIHLYIGTAEEGSSKISIFNSLGTLVYVFQPFLTKGDQTFEIDCSDWTSGFYFLRVQSGRHAAARKFVITNR